MSPFGYCKMGVPDSHFEELERQRRELEDNILKLQESLYHWRTWEAEYDGLKDEINGLDDDATTDEFLRIGHDFGGDLVNEEEVKVILGARQGVTRSKEQAVNLIVRRIDYVKENVKTIEKRLHVAENKLSELGATGQAPVEMGGDFPMTEIMEELDEEGNVVSSSMQTPGSQAPELLGILKKAGVKDVPDAQTATVEEARPDEESNIQGQGASDTPQFETEPAPAEVGEVAEEHPVTDVNESPEDAALRREMLEYGLNEVGSVVAELELDGSASDVSLDDSYGDYEEDENEDEDEDEDEFGRSTHSVLSEDYHKQMRDLEEKLNARGMWNMGKDASSLPSEMKQDLQQPQAMNIEISDKDATVSKKGISKKGKQKKKVSFADDLDIAPAEEPSPEKRTLPPQQPDIPAITDSVVERAESAPKTVSKEPPKKASRFKSARSGMTKSTPDETPAPPQSSTPLRPPEVRSTPHTATAPVSPGLPIFPAKPAEPRPFSQPIADIFQHEKPPAFQPQSQAHPPEDRILAEKLVERDIPEGKATAPEKEDLDDQLHRKEIASEYYRLRNRMGQQNEGFDDEPETVPLETEEVPKVSKFKASRMR